MSTYWQRRYKTAREVINNIRAILGLKVGCSVIDAISDLKRRNEIMRTNLDEVTGNYRRLRAWWIKVAKIMGCDPKAVTDQDLLEVIEELPDYPDYVPMHTGSYGYICESEDHPHRHRRLARWVKLEHLEHLHSDPHGERPEGQLYLCDECHDEL